MITRVTHQTAQRTSLANLQANLTKMSDLQAQASSGKVITKASDDPAKAAEAMALRKEQRAVEQHARNAQDGVSWLTVADSAIRSSVGLMQQARDLAVQGANTGALNGQGREAIALELEGVRDALLAQANTTYLGRSVFAGTANGPAFTVTDGEYTHATTNGPVERRVSSTHTVRVDADGAATFGTGTDPEAADYSVFAMLTDVAATLRAGGSVSPAIDTIDSRIGAMLNEASSVGSRTNQLTAAQDMLSNQTLTLKSDLSGVEDIDLAQTIIELQMQEVAYQAALGATSRVLQPSLMDYLK